MNRSFTANATLVAATPTRFNLLAALSFSHFLNDMMQSLIVAIYPLLKGEFHLSFVQIGSITLTSAFSAIVVFAQELMPGNVGAVSGLFFGFAFGIGGIGAAVLGGLADAHGIEFVYRICAYLPLLGMVAAFLPNIEHKKPP
jgi:hypothetical protein